MAGRRVRWGAGLGAGLAAALVLAAASPAGATVIAWSSILPIFPGSASNLPGSSRGDYGRMDFAWVDESAVLQSTWPSFLPFRPLPGGNPFLQPSPLPLAPHPFVGSVLDQFSWNFQMLLALWGALGAPPPPAAVPEPGAAPLVALAAAALAALRRRR